MPLRTTRRVTRREPCPICDRPDWCRVSQNGRYAICNRIESDRPARDNGGGWIHLLDATVPASENPSRPRARASNSRHLAPIDQRDRVYRQFLAAATLNEQHALDLRGRGFSDAEITSRGYKTLPLLGRTKLVWQAYNGTPDGFHGVPGFFLRSGAGVPYPTIAGSPVLLIPVRDPIGRIRALRIRPDGPGDGGKYRWLSSGKKNSGTGSGAHCHVAWPTCALRDDAIWIAEGEIKADLSAERLGAVVVSIPGVSLWKRALPDLAELLSKGGRVVVALDADWPEKAPVHEAIWGLTQACLALGYTTEVATWTQKSGKGLDDLLMGGCRAERMAPAAFPALGWEMKVSSRMLAMAPPRSIVPAMRIQEMREKLAACLCR